MELKKLLSWDSLVSSVIAHGLFIPQIATLYQLTCQDGWKMDLLPSNILAARIWSWYFGRT
jgi:hypothetical protein